MSAPAFTLNLKHTHDYLNSVRGGKRFLNLRLEGLEEKLKLGVVRGRPRAALACSCQVHSCHVRVCRVCQRRKIEKRGRRSTIVKDIFNSLLDL
jgi:hypothetical protein